MFSFPRLFKKMGGNLARNSFQNRPDPHKDSIGGDGREVIHGLWFVVWWCTAYGIRFGGSCPSSVGKGNMHPRAVFREQAHAL